MLHILDHVGMLLWARVSDAAIRMKKMLRTVDTVSLLLSLIDETANAADRVLEKLKIIELIPVVMHGRILFKVTS